MNTDPLTILTIVGIIATIVGTGIGIIKTIYWYKDRKPNFGKFQRINFESNNWQVLIHSPSMPIARCSATFRNVQLGISGMKVYERSLALGEGVNFQISNVLENDDGMVKIKDGNKTIIKRKFNEIPIA